MRIRITPKILLCFIIWSMTIVIDHIKFISLDDSIEIVQMVQSQPCSGDNLGWKHAMGVSKLFTLVIHINIPIGMNQL
jgi:hypothetical protein